VNGRTNKHPDVRGSIQVNNQPIVLVTIDFDLNSNFKDFYNIIEVKFPKIDKTHLLANIGENGFNLSGGERQRLSLARALYKNTDILILDEFTSSLDIKTEKAVMDAVHNLNHKITIILITHRLDTIQKCEQVFLLDQGKIIANGLYDELVKSNKKFKKLIFKE
jgi:ABC-type multidrug transport system fused ATPase/permease subunit